jgi:hypothetical protein
MINDDWEDGRRQHITSEIVEVQEREYSENKMKGPESLDMSRLAEEGH